MKNKKLMKDLPEVKLFNKYIDDKPIALAVSGGPDSENRWRDGREGLHRSSSRM